MHNIEAQRNHLKKPQGFELGSCARKGWGKGNCGRLYLGVDGRLREEEII